MSDTPPDKDMLLPCPFCGGEAVIHSQDSGVCACDNFNCNIYLVFFELSAWNTRHRPKVSLGELALIMSEARNPKAIHQGKNIAQAILNYLKQLGVQIDVTE